MYKTLLLTFALLLSAVCVQAQPANPPSDKKDSAASLTTIEGCLQSAHGNYTLTDNDNTLHVLTGATSKLSHQVGHQVEITGKPGIRTIDTTPEGGASSAREQPVIEVKSVKHIADTCK